MSDQLILEKLGNLEKQSDKLDKKVDKIETAVGLIAVQTERINNVSSQVNSLWEKYDTAFAPSGVINQVQNFQASCPREEIKRQWIIISLLATVVSGALLKAFGVF